MIVDFARRRAEIDADRTAFVEGIGGRLHTYGAFDARADRAAQVLRNAGVGRGDRVATLTLNEVAFFELLIGAARLGAILVPLNWRLAADEFLPILADCTPRLLIHDAANAEMATRLLVPRLSLSEYGAQKVAGERRAADWEADGVWYLLYTSGTTGRPKAVIQTFGMAEANRVNLSGAIGLTGDDRTLNFLPLFHTAGINLHTLPTLMSGGTVTIFPRFDPEEVIEAIATDKVTCFFGVPAIYQALASHPRFPAIDLGRVRSWSCGGAPLAEPLLRAFLARGARVCAGYGMTETGPTLCLMDPARVEAKIGSSGRAQALSKVRIVDERGRDVPHGTTGEVLVKGPNVTPGYWNNREATRDAFTADGWLKTGDLGRLDADGYVTIVDRLKDMFISGGENVYPAEVEHALIAHPAVQEAAVIGVADARWGEVGRAYVVPKPGTRPDPDELTAFCRERIAAYKVPKTIRLVAELPRTAAGKVQKHLLRARPD